jgi:serine protease
LVKILDFVSEKIVYSLQINAMNKLLLFILVSLVASANLRAQSYEPRETPFKNGEVLVQLRKGFTVDQVMNQFPAAVKMHAIKNLSKHMLFWHLGFDSTVISNRDVLRKLMGLPSINLAQNNHYIQDRATVPNDVSFTSQWHHKNTSASGGTVDADIDSDEAWDITTGGVTSCGDTIVVALVEPGGAYWNHNDLLPNMWHNYAEIPGNSLDDDGNGYIDDVDGWNVNAANDNHPTGSHGTNCFGMMGAKGNNTTGVTGINWDLKVMLVSNFGVTEAGCIAAYDYPLNMRQRYNSTNGAQGAFVVASSSSWGIDYADPAAYPLWCAFYDTCGVYGILSVGATTNNTVDVDAVGDMPTACSSNYMVSVTRTSNTDGQAGGYGLTTIDFGAPGISVYTTSGSSSSTYTTTTGTSFSCPLTAGTIALCYSVPCVEFMSMVKADPQAGADFVFNALKNNVDITAAMTGKSVTNGRLNAFKAVNDIFTSCSALPTPLSLTATGATTSSVNLNWVDGGTSAGFYYYYRMVGSPTWDSVYTTSTSVTITGLTPCSDYESKVAAYVCNTLSAYSTITNFNTIGVIPSGLNGTVLTDTTASITWGSVSPSIGYNIQYKEVSAGSFTLVTGVTSPYTLTGLLPCTDYEVQVQTVCASSTTAFSASDFFTTTCLGFDDLSGNSKFFSIYPNPASGEFTLNLLTHPANGQVSFSLVNAVGEVVQINAISSKTTQINISSLSSGVYTYVVKLSDNTLRRGKLVINK